MLIAFLGLASAAPPSLEMGDTAFEINRNVLCLPSGLRVLYHHEPSHKSVYWTTVVDVGSTAEPPGQEGLAHLVEHLWFDTAAFRRVSSRVASNATIDPDVTVYYALGGDDQLGPLVEAESRRFGLPLRGVDEAIVEREKRIVEAERRWRYENRSLSSFAMLPNVFNEGHPYHRPTIGTAESIASLTLEQARTFSATHVTPNRTSWVVTGPQTFEAFQELLKTRAADWIWRPSPDASCAPAPPPKAPPVERPRETRWLELEAATAQPHAVVGWVLPPAFGRDHIQQQRGVEMVDSVGGWSCRHLPLRQASMATCRMGLDGSPGHRPYRDQVQTLLDRIHWTWDSSDRDYQSRVFSRAYHDTLSRLFLNLEDTSANHTDAELWHHTGDLEGWVRRIQQAAPAKVGSDNLVLEDWFSQRRATVAIVTPRSQVSEVAQGRSHGPPRSDTPIGTDVEPTDARTLETLAKVDTQALRVQRFDNGLNVWVLPFGASPFARSHLVLAGARATAPDLAIHELFWDLLVDDVNIQNMNIYRSPLVIGGDWSDWRGADRTELGIRSVKNKLDAQLYLLRARLDATRLDFEGQGDILDREEDRMWTRLQDAQTWAQLHREASLFGAPDGWTPELMGRARKVKKGDVKAWLQQVLRPQEATLIIVGDVNPSRALGEAKRYFGDWKTKNRAPLKLRQVVKRAVEPSVTVFEDSSRTDVTISVSCPRLQSSTYPLERISRKVIDELVTGQLRETWGATYTVSVWLDHRGAEQAVWNIETEVPGSVAGPAVMAIRETLQRIASGKISKRYLAYSRLNYARSSRFGLRDPAVMLGRLLEVARRDGDVTHLEREGDELLAVSREAVASQLADCAGHEVVTLVGPGKPIWTSLTEAKVNATQENWDVNRNNWLSKYAPKRR
ncbi:MAG: insulinase family protein [Myxococcota bacterium]